MSKPEQTKRPRHRRKDRATEIANTFEWLVTAFILAFVFRAFVMEAFRIPTGSMADTLNGAHFRMRCRQCGYGYNHGFIPGDYRMQRETTPNYSVRPPRTRCPSCTYYPQPGRIMPVVNGDKILVLKCLYQFSEPKQWDVVVFKNPLEPRINYIKRLIARPGETVEIIDGDVYINGQISRKPPKVQNELWMPIYDNDHQPVRPRERLFNGTKWRQPFKTTGSKWKIHKDSPTQFTLDSRPKQINTLTYDAATANNFRAAYAYNDIQHYKIMPYCSDLMVRFYANSAEAKGRIGVNLSKYQTHYSAWVDWAGNMVIEKTNENAKITELNSKKINPAAVNKPARIKFANVDHQLIFEFGDEKLTYDLGRSPEDAGPRKTDIQPRVQIFGSGKLTLSHVALFRDIHYTQTNGSPPGRAIEGNPFKLEADQFFVLGDNSPNSEDGRWWNEKGIANNGHTYDKGIVPRDYLVGKALFVYWPSGFDFPWPQNLRKFLLENSQHSRLYQVAYAITSLRWIPNIGRMRLIYGGSDKNQ